MTQAGTHAREARPGPSPGPAVLDIGAHIGAAVVYTTQLFDGVELEIRQQESDWDGTHRAVRRRPGGSPNRGPVYAALFDRLTAGRYGVRVLGAGAAAGVHSLEVLGGQVTETTFEMGQ